MQNSSNSKYSGLEELLSLELMRNYNNSIVKQSLKYDSNIKKIVDFGAGIGTLSIIFRKKYIKDIICIEIDKTNIEYLKKRNFKYIHDIDNLLEPVDMVFSSNVLEHIQDDLNTLRKLREKLKDNGILFLYVPAKMILWNKLDEIVGHYRRYEISQLKNLSQKAGFKIVNIHYSDFIGFFILLFWNLINVTKKPLPSKKTLIFYDKYIFPISRFLDKLGFKYLVGKNIIMVAKK